MRGFSSIFFIAALVTPCTLAYGDSFLTATSFPKTFNDVSFVDRMQVLAEGYEDFDPVYDENGVCISGCAYKGITLEKELDMIERNTRIANARLEKYKLEHPEEFQQQYEQRTTQTTQNQVSVAQQNTAQTVTVQTPSTTATQNTGAHSGNNAHSNTQTAQNSSHSAPQTNNTQHQNTHTQPSATTSYSGSRTCAHYSNSIKPMNVVAQAPLDGQLVITSDFGSRTKPCSDCSSNHRGIDLRAATGTNLYAPANGTVTVVKTAARGCGQQIQITHPDGIITQYCHLSQQLVKVGDKVQGGCLIGKTGNTGSSTGPHLHYALMVGPQQFLDPLWTENRLGRPYEFKSGTPQSKEHSGKTLPGKQN